MDVSTKKLYKGVTPSTIVASGEYTWSPEDTTIAFEGSSFIR
ncbi:19191_t:CDS:2 [Cetraspora pellucida]|uniref:19191_t:CDS:1 n=1 Tax=Cetraspora pellucida TaxID=1433469 RepID=A0A9N9DQA0_9GLOM|nr:19191_t:CDS:2 [Cetraspora pellucida]